MVASPPPGLCDRCRHVRRVRSRRGSVFFLCGRAAFDSRFRKYPPIPVLSCSGFEPDTDPETAPDPETALDVDGDS